MRGFQCPHEFVLLPPLLLLLLLVSVILPTIKKKHGAIPLHVRVPKIVSLELIAHI